MAGRPSIRKSQERAEKAFEWHIKGQSNKEIAKRLGVSETAAGKLVRKMAREHPLTTMSAAERAGVCAAMMAAISRELWQEIADAKQRGARDELRSLLGIASLHSQRVSRVMLDQADVAISVVNVSESTVNSLAPMGADCYQAWLQSGGPGALTAMPPQGLTVETSPVPDVP